jgi:hypothetical protein
MSFCLTPGKFGGINENEDDNEKALKAQPVLFLVFVLVETFGIRFGYGFS